MTCLAAGSGMTVLLFYVARHRFFGMEHAKEKHREHAINRYHRRMQMVRIMLGGKCVRCGTTENLQFDHIDASTKTATVADLAASASKMRLLDEISKCQLLCQSCHTKKGQEIGDVGKATHGSGGMYKHHKCRCDICVTANRLWWKNYRQRKPRKNAG